MSAVPGHGDELDDETVVVPRQPTASPTGDDSTGLDDETIVVPRAAPVVESVDDETVVVARPEPEPELDDHTVVVARPASVPEPDDHTVVVARPPAVPAAAEPDDATVVVPRAAPEADDSTIVVPRSAPAPTPPAPIMPASTAPDDDATAIVDRAVAPPVRPNPLPTEAGPGTIENARKAFVPGAASADSTELLKQRYQIRSEVTTVPVAAERAPFAAAPNRHAVKPIDEIAEKTNRMNRSRGIGVIVAVIGVTVLVAAAIGVILLVVLNL